MFRNDDRGTGRFRMMVQFCVRIFIVDYDMEIGYGIGALLETLWCQHHTNLNSPQQIVNGAPRVKGRSREHVEEVGKVRYLRYYVSHSRVLLLSDLILTD
jgi:hypothetical protein